MTDLTRLLAVLSVGLPALSAALMWAARTPRQSDLIARLAGLATAAPALVLSALAIAHHRHPLVDGRWLLIDDRSGLFVAVTATVGLASVMLSPTYLRTAGRSWLSPTASHDWYYTALFLFWAALLAVPVTGNLALVWLLVDATTAASALPCRSPGIERRSRQPGSTSS